MQKFKSRASGLNVGAQIDGKRPEPRGPADSVFLTDFKFPGAFAEPGCVFAFANAFLWKAKPPQGPSRSASDGGQLFRDQRPGGPRAEGAERGRESRQGGETYTKEVFDSFQNRSKNFSPKTGKFLIPIKYRNCYFFSVS